jgi:hypothetical protein
MSIKSIGTGLLFLLCCVMEALALVQYFKFPNVQALHIGVILSISGAIFLICSIRLYRSGKKNQLLSDSQVNTPMDPILPLEPGGNVPDTSIDRIQVAMAVIFIVDVLFLVVSIVLTRSLSSANSAGYSGMLVLGSLCLYTGYRRLPSLRNKAGGAVWYKQPWILCGWTIYILLILFFISNFGKM